MTLPAGVGPGLAALAVGGTTVAAVAAWLEYGEWRRELAQRLAKDPDRPPGLVNLANHCYVNALLQALAGCPVVLDWLHALPQGSPADAPVSTALRRLLGELSRASWDTSSALPVVQALESQGWRLGGQEQDLFELLNVLLTSWDEELAELCPSLPSLRDLSAEEPGPSEGPDGLEAVASSSAPSSGALERLSLGRLGLRALSERVAAAAGLRAPWAGLVGTRLQCRECGRKRVRHDAAPALSLNFPETMPAGQSASLYHCLRRYFAVEVLKGAECEGCRRPTEHVKRQGLSKLPDALLLRLERRVVGPGGAVGTRGDWLAFPHTLHLGDFLFHKPRAAYAETEGLPPASRSTYGLCSVVEHLGSGGGRGGHFVAYRRGGDGGWLRFDDARVHRVPADEVYQRPAYLLLYQRLPAPHHPKPLKELSSATSEEPSQP